MIRLLVGGPLAAGSLAVTGDDHHYLFRVRRLTLGDRLIVCDGAGREAAATVESIEAETARLAVEPPGAPAHRQGPALVALVPLIKGDRTDLAIEKLVELGAARILPYAADRSVVRLAGSRAADRHRRYEAIARSAAAQCRSPLACEIAPITDLGAALAAVAGAALKLLFSEQAGAPGLDTALPPGPLAEVALLTGPEGGLTDAEVAAAVAVGFVAVSLGPRVLRAETAAIAALTAVGYAIGDLGPGGTTTTV